MKKRIIALLLGVAMLLPTPMAASAATINSTGGTNTADVKGKYITSELKEVYSVDVSWGAMEFDYYEGGKKWNSQTHKWEADAENAAGWTVNKNSNQITLENNSSKMVKALFTFAPEQAYKELSGKFSTLDNADLKFLDLKMPEADKPADKYIVEFMPSGKIPKTHSTNAYAKIGTVTVTLE